MSPNRDLDIIERNCIGGTEDHVPWDKFSKMVCAIVVELRERREFPARPLPPPAGDASARDERAGAALDLLELHALRAERDRLKYALSLSDSRNYFLAQEVRKLGGDPGPLFPIGPFLAPGAS